MEKSFRRASFASHAFAQLEGSTNKQHKAGQQTANSSGLGVGRIVFPSYHANNHDLGQQCSK